MTIALEPRAYLVLGSNGGGLSSEDVASLRFLVHALCLREFQSQDPCGCELGWVSVGMSHLLICWSHRRVSWKNSFDPKVASLYIFVVVWSSMLLTPCGHTH